MTANNLQDVGSKGPLPSALPTSSVERGSGSVDHGRLGRLVRRCVTHHFACDCRESLFAESLQTQRKAVDWSLQSDQGLRLRCGELTQQEIRTIRAVLSAILPTNTQIADA